MKKLMIAAAAVALVGAAQAMPTTGEQVYQATMLLRTTDAELGQVNNICAELGKSYYRAQTFKQIDGIIWGCWCQTIATPTAYTATDADGYLWWNVTDEYLYDDFTTTAFAWTLLHRIYNDALQSEGVATLTLAFMDAEGNSQTEYDLTLAGFGTAAGLPAAEKSLAFVPEIKGFVVGTRAYVCTGKDKSFCTEGSTYSVAYWELCDCAESTKNTPAYGQWSIKINEVHSDNLAIRGDIEDTVIFPPYVAVKVGPAT